MVKYDDKTYFLDGYSSYVFLITLFCNDTASTATYTYGHSLSLHDALPFWCAVQSGSAKRRSFGRSLGDSTAASGVNPGVSVASEVQKAAPCSHIFVDCSAQSGAPSLPSQRPGSNSEEIGRTACRARVCQYVQIRVAAGRLNKQNSKKQEGNNRAR